MRLSSILFVLFAMPVFGDDNCHKLKETMLQVEGLPQKVEAGKSAAPVTFEVTDYAAELMEPYKFVIVTVLLKNEVTGAFKPYVALEVKKPGEKISKAFKHTFAIPQTAQGTYRLNVYLQALAGSGSCYANLATLEEHTLEVPSHPGADVHPPLVAGSRFDKKTAKPGEKVALLFSVTDREGSQICTGEAKEAKLCTETANFHLELKGEDSLHTYDAVTKVDSGNYRVDFTVPADAKPGIYHLETLNLFDLAGNSSHEVSDEQKKTSLQIIPEK